MCLFLNALKLWRPGNTQAGQFSLVILKAIKGKRLDDLSKDSLSKRGDFSKKRPAPARAAGRENSLHSQQAFAKPRRQESGLRKRLESSLLFLADLPFKARRTVAFDNGGELPDHQTFTKLCSTKAFFCDSYASWQKVLNSIPPY